jgi:hypothetical protein
MFRDEANLNGDYAVNNVPVECWENILGHLSPAELAQAASINKACSSASEDQRLWSPHFVREWGLECHVSPQSQAKVFGGRGVDRNLH